MAQAPDSSPVLALRGFRFQKKPQLESQSSSEILNSSQDSSPDKPAAPPVRKRIIIFSDSDSEVDTSIVKPPVKPSTIPSISPDKPSPQGTVTVPVVPNGLSSASNVAASNVVQVNGVIDQKAEVKEKEKQMRFLLEIFPNIETMQIHDILSKHSFNTDAAAAELSRTNTKSMMESTYSKWSSKESEKNNITNKVVTNSQNSTGSSSASNPTRTSFAPNPTRTSSAPNPTQSSSAPNKRRAEGEPKKKKVKRRKEYESDDSTGSNADFKDRRVFHSDEEDSDAEITDDLTGDKKKVFDFFDTATANELQLMAYCSKKKVDAIIESRPFNGWVDLVTKLQTNKNLTTDLLNSAQQVLLTRSNIRILMRRCNNLAQQLERAVAAGAGVKKQPANLSPNLKLTSYQMVGLNWLAVLHYQKVNGILADEMGLGKTVQIIAFLAYLKLAGQAQNTHLIVVPSSTLDNWKNEFARWCPELRVFMYYGSTEERRSFRFDLAKGMLAEFDVILTTYTIIGNSSEEKRMFKVTPMHYVVFDEAHMLKNMNTQRYENLIRINAKHRILLTGTPLQNNLLELMSLLVFVMPKMFGEKVDDLKNLFQKNSKTKDDQTVPAFEREQIEQAKRIMKPFVLRRLKRDVLQDLPKKTDLVVTVSMLRSQKQQYEQLVAAYKNIGQEGEKYNGMSIMTDLRKLSNHPLLMRYQYDLEKINDIAQLLATDPGYKDTVVQYIADDLMWMSDFEIHTMCQNFRCLNKFILPDSLIVASGKFTYLDKCLPNLQKDGHRVLIFSQYVILLNVLEVYLRIRNYKYLRLDGSTQVAIRQDLINEYTEDKSIFIFLLSTRAGGLGINLTSADTVIIHDIDFNPYNDKQAEDRCHRMGQTKPVTVYRLISQGTIEEGMLAMCREKLRLEKDITAEESDNPDVKSVVKLLSSVLGIDSNQATNLVSPNKEAK